MFVLAIISILAVVTVPKYRAMTDYYHLQSSVQTVTTFIRYAKQRALDEHKANYVVITKSNNLVQVRNDPSLSLLEYQAKSLDSGVSLLSSTNTIDNSVMSYVYFNNRGYLAQSNMASFTLKSSSNRTVKINIDLLGNVTSVWD